MNTPNPCYFGRGQVWFTAPLGVDGVPNTAAYGTLGGENWPDVGLTAGELLMPPGRFVGNARGMVVSPQTRRAATSAWDSGNSLIVEGVQLGITLFGHGARNLADALHALHNQSAGLPATDVIATGAASVAAGCILFTRHLVNTALPVTVTPSWTAWTEGVEWAREGFGIRMLQGFAGPADSQVSIAYNGEADADNLDGLTQTGAEIGIVYTGVNRADGAPVRFECYRGLPQLDGGLQGISEQFGEIAIQFDLRPVRPVSADPLSRWYRVQRSNFPAV